MDVVHKSIPGDYKHISGRIYKAKICGSFDKPAPVELTPKTVSGVHFSTALGRHSEMVDLQGVHLSAPPPGADPSRSFQTTTPAKPLKPPKPPKPPKPAKPSKPDNHKITPNGFSSHPDPVPWSQRKARMDSALAWLKSEMVCISSLKIWIFVTYSEVLNHLPFLFSFPSKFLAKRCVEDVWNSVESMFYLILQCLSLLFVELGFFMSLAHLSFIISVRSWKILTRNAFHVGQCERSVRNP